MMHAEEMNNIFEEEFLTSLGEGSSMNIPRERLEISGDSTKYWIPECEQQIKPKQSMVFDNLAEGVQFYRKYGQSVGFDVRISTTKRFRSEIIRVQYIVCNKEGFKHVAKSQREDSSKSSDTGESSEPRHRTSGRVGCNARCIFEYVENGRYKVKHFEERHTHSLIPDKFQKFLKVNRDLNFGHQQFIINCAKANIGNAKSHRLYTQMVGGYSNTGALQIDFKNFRRELKAYISGADAQLVIDRFLKKMEVSPGMAFNYDVDKNEQLTRLFWADPICRINYAAFGDVISFDATYNTNRYKMVFAPFTGIDNHKRCVTFASGLLLKEVEESYVWLFQKFIEAMGREPIYIVTDQDPTMKNAIRRVFKNTIHRLCMWHIMEKVTVKLGHALFNDECFMKRLKDLVWNNCIEPEYFEEKWSELMTEYNLTSHAWLRNIFEIRRSWIPAYFKNVELGGLLRTTSRSESANSWFGSFTNPQVNLVEFFMHYESAMEAQRHATDKLTNRQTQVFRNARHHWQLKSTQRQCIPGRCFPL